MNNYYIKKEHKIKIKENVLKKVPKKKIYKSNKQI